MFRETCHPPWPSRLVGLVVVAVPLELPEFLDGHMPHGMIHEHTLNAAIVPVHGKMFHLGVKTAPFTVVLGWSLLLFIGPPPRHIISINIGI